MSNLIGKEIGGYRILAQIGMGGMAKVYKAYQAKMDRVVALKVLPEQYSKDETFLKRFDQEARIIANLENRNIQFNWSFSPPNIVRTACGKGSVIGGEFLVERDEATPCRADPYLSVAPPLFDFNNPLPGLSEIEAANGRPSRCRS